MRKAFGGAQGDVDYGSTRMSIFRSKSGATVLTGGILSSSPRTRLPDYRYTAFLIMPETLSNASAAAAAAAAVAPVPYSKCVGAESSCLLLSPYHRWLMHLAARPSFARPLGGWDTLGFFLGVATYTYVHPD